MTSTYSEVVLLVSSWTENALSVFNLSSRVSLETLLFAANSFLKKRKIAAGHQKENLNEHSKPLNLVRKPKTLALLSLLNSLVPPLDRSLSVLVITCNTVWHP